MPLRGTSLHHQRVIFHRELYVAALSDLAADERAGELSLDVALQKSLERTSTEYRIVTLLGRPLLRFLIERHGHPPVGEVLHACRGPSRVSAELKISSGARRLLSFSDGPQPRDLLPQQAGEGFRVW